MAGRGAVFFEVIPRDAPGRAGFAARIGFCLDAARRAAVRDDFDVPRLTPAEVFFLLLFFKRRCVFSATDFAWNSRSLTPVPDIVPEKISTPRRAASGCSSF